MFCPRFSLRSQDLLSSSHHSHCLSPAQSLDSLSQVVVIELLLALDPPAFSKGVRVDGMHMLWSSIYNSPSFKTHSTISRDTSLNKFFIQLSSVTDEDTAMYYCSRENHTVRDLCLSPDINFLQQCWRPVGDSQYALSIGLSPRAGTELNILKLLFYILVSQPLTLHFYWMFEDSFPCHDSERCYSSENYFRNCRQGQIFVNYTSPSIVHFSIINAIGNEN